MVLACAITVVIKAIQIESSAVVSMSKNVVFREKDSCLGTYNVAPSVPSQLFQVFM